MKKAFLMILALGFMVFSADLYAKDKKAKKAKGGATEVSITGTITKATEKKKKKEVTVYTITDEAGTATKINLGKKLKKTLKLENYVDKKVKLTGKGKKSKKGLSLSEGSVEEVTAEDS